MRLVDHPALVAAARHGVASNESRVTVSRADADYMLGCVRTDRLGGLLAQAVTAGIVELDSDTDKALTEEWRSELKACVQLEALGARTAALLDDAGIAWRLSKGAALAHLDYRDPTLRTFGDVDIVVHPDHWVDAFTMLSAHGWRRQGATLPGGYDDR